MFENLTLVELNAMTKDAIISAIVADRPNAVTECTKSIDCKDGQVSRKYVTKDLAGVVIKTEQWDWKYDKSGVVSEIIKTVLDAKSSPIEAVKIVTVDGTLKAVPVELKALQVEEVIEK